MRYLYLLCSDECKVYDMIEECLFNEYLNLFYFLEYGFKIFKKNLIIIILNWYIWLVWKKWLDCMFNDVLVLDIVNILVRNKNNGRWVSKYWIKINSFYF